MLEVVKPGLSSSVQDLGRQGYYHLGIPLSGAMDRYSHAAANLLVGNDVDAATIEVVFVGPEIVFRAATVIAVTGATVPILIDGVEQPSWTALQVREGQTLAFKFLKSGARFYIAIAGGIDVPVVLGSRSTYALGSLGGHQGRPLKAGDVLKTLPAPQKAEIGRSIDVELLPDVSRSRIRVLPGLYDYRVTDDSRDQFFSEDWKVAPEADRVGYRFKGGSPLRFVERVPPFGAGSDPSNVVDSCYPYGSIQVPSGTEPIVLHRDAVSGGGYLTIGAVISADMDLIGQLVPGRPVRFEPVSMADALSARQEASQKLQRLKSSFI